MVAGVDPANECGDDGAQVAARLQAALRAAMRARDPVAMAAPRSALSAIGNAEVARRQLSHAQVEAIVAAEISERESAAAGYEATGVPAEAERLRREVSVLQSVMSRADQES